MMQPAPHPHPDDETLSAFVDGELSDDIAETMIKQLSSNAASRARLTEYWAVGDALRGLSGQAPDLTQRVMAVLESEPTVLAPRRKQHTRQPTLWLDAATVAAIAWGLWQAVPRTPSEALMAAAPSTQHDNVMPYLAAHQDFAQAMVSTSEMQFTPVNLAEAGR